MPFFSSLKVEEISSEYIASFMFPGEYEINKKTKIDVKSSVIVCDITLLAIFLHKLCILKIYSFFNNLSFYLITYSIFCLIVTRNIYRALFI